MILSISIIITYCLQATSAMKALFGSSQKLAMEPKRRGRLDPLILQFNILQACLDGWTLDKFQLVVQGIKDYRFVVGDFRAKKQTVS